MNDNELALRVVKVLEVSYVPLHFSYLKMFVSEQFEPTIAVQAEAFSDLLAILEACGIINCIANQYFSLAAEARHQLELLREAALSAPNPFNTLSALKRVPTGEEPPGATPTKRRRLD